MSKEIHPSNSALCAQYDPESFFPQDGPIGQREARYAKAICMQCNAQVKCLDYALNDRSLVGIWGGTDEADRKRIRRFRNQQLGQTSLQEVFAELDRYDIDEQIA